MERITYEVGGRMTVRGHECRIVKDHGFGTLTVESLNGLYRWQVTGLPMFRY
jgi:hypothetical protein